MFRRVVIVAILFAAGPATAQPQAENRAVARCLDLIRGCQLPDGAIVMAVPTQGAASPVWIQPYFAAHAALALLAPNPDSKAAASDRTRVGKWLEWCAARQEKGGYWCDHVGTVAGYKSNGEVDAHDSSAALFLVVVERYHRVGGKVSPRTAAAAAASLKCLDGLTDTDGLTWAKPDYKVKYLMDNVEVHAGLTAAGRFLTASGKKAEGAAAADKAEALGKALARFWEAKEKGRFAWALHPNGRYDGGLDEFYPHGLAQLFGVAFVAAEPAAFQTVLASFQPKNTPEAAGAERYLIAAARLGDKDEVAKWRAETARVAGAFDRSVYVFRPGLAVLALREGADWMPSGLSAAK